MSSLVQQIAGVFKCLLCIFFDVSKHVRCAVMNIGREYCFGSKE
jgi:hypothetical protein